MKTTSRIFATLFLALAICAALGALGGATHQWAVAAICSIMSAVLYSDGKNINHGAGDLFLTRRMRRPR